MSFAEGAALSGKATNVVARVDSRGPSALTIKNKGLVDVVAFYRRRSGARLVEASDVKYGSELVDSDTDSLANTPVGPGSLSIVASTLTLIDRDGDGKLRLLRGVGVSLASGSNGVTSVAATRTLTAAAETFQTKKVLPGDLVVLKNTVDKETFVVVAVNSETVLLLDKNFATGVQTAVEYEVFSNDLQVGTINYFTGALNVSLPATGAIPGSKASIVGSNAFPLNFNAGDAISFDVDGGGNVPAVFAAAAATLAGAAGTFAAMAAETMQVRFRTGATFTEWQTVTFGTEATQQLAVDLINTQVVGGEARINGANVDLVSDGEGSGSRVETQSVAAGITTKLGIADASNADGTGDAANINAVTFAEFKLVVETDITGVLATLDDVTLGPRVTNTTISVGVASTLQTPLGEPARIASGFDTALHTGAQSDASSGMVASYTKTSLVAAGKRVVQSIVVSDADNVSVRFAANASRSLVNVEITQPRQ